MRYLLLSLSLVFLAVFANAQSFIKVEVLNGSSTTTCTDANSEPENLWGVNIEGEGYDYYAPSGFCELNAPNIQYEGFFPCGDILQDSVEVCFRAMEFDGFTYCLVNGECIEDICKKFPVPTMGKTFHALELPSGGSSEGVLEFSIAGFEASTPAYDDICAAIDLGIVNIGDTIGNANLGIYHNHCTSNVGEIDTYPLTGWFNNNGIWITFTTGSEETPYIDLIMKSDPENLGDPVSFQMASFFSDNDACDGTLDYFVQYFDVSDNDETMILNCIPPNTTFYILVDGVADQAETLQGIFGLSLEAYDAHVAANDKCDAMDFGQIPEGGEVMTTEIQVNRCADASGEPSVPIFSSERTVWYTFTTPSSGNVLVEAFTDTIKESIDLELAIFSSTNDACFGSFVHEKSSYDSNSFDEVLVGSCLEPNRQYWLLVDGQTDNVKGSFHLKISDGGPIQTFFPVDGFICSGDFYEVGSNTYSNSGVFLDTFILANGCDSIIETTLIAYDAISSGLVELQEATALGINDASVLVNVSGGTGVYSIVWENGSTEFQQNDLIGGDTICFVVTDDFGCDFSDCIVAPFNNNIVPDITLQPVQCYGDDSGVIGIAAFNGVAPYDVTVVQPNGDVVVFQLPFDNIGFELLDLFAGTYNCTITDINNTINFDIELTQNDSLSYTVLNELPISCYGECDGLIELQISGGVQPYFYAWNTGGNQSEESNLCAGSYELTVTDFLGCLNVFEIEITEPDSINGFIAVNSDVNCKGDETGVLEYITSDASLDFIWSNDSTNTLNENLSAGIYTITVSDQLGCSKVLVEEIMEPEFDLSGEILLDKPIKCFGETNGALNALVFGGNGSYSYNWNTNFDMQVISGIGQGLYSVSVVDEKGCEIELDYDLVQPDLLQGAVDKKDVQCSDTEFGGSILLNYFSGGTGSVEYSVDGFFFQDDNEFKFLAPGFYDVIIKDSFNCEWSESLEIKSPEEISVLLTGLNSIELGDELYTGAILSNPDLQTTWFINGESFDCDNCTEIYLDPLEDVSILVVAKDTASNCETRDAINVEVRENLNLYFPNVFSPNGDSFNEKFYPFQTKNTEIVKEFSIFNRYGQLLYSISDFAPGDENFGWDGKVDGRPASIGVYTFYANIEFINGKEVIFKGAVTLVR
jgi:gliding motility-associated-like protein